MVAELENQSPPSSNGEHALVIPANELSKDRFGIGRDKLNEAIENLPPGDAQKVEALWKYCAQRNLGRDRLGQLLLKPASFTKGSKRLKTPRRNFYSADSIYQLLTGRRSEQGASIAPMLRAITEFLEKAEPGADLEGFIETRLYREIKMYAERAKRLHRIGYLVGRMSNGKTWALKKIAEKLLGCLYTQMPTGGVYSDYVRECAGAMATMSTRQAVQKIRGKVLDALPEMVIVDDADLAFDTARQANGVKTFQYLKEAYDRKPRGFLLSMDDWGFKQFLTGDNAHRLGRLWRRRIAPLYVPEVPYQEDLDLFAASVKLDPAPDKDLTIKIKWKDEKGKEREREHEDSPARLQTAVCEKDGIGVWLTMLRDAADLAREQGKAISWGAVLKVHALDAAMEERAGVKQ